MLDNDHDIQKAETLTDMLLLKDFHLHDIVTKAYRCFLSAAESKMLKGMSHKYRIYCVYSHYIQSHFLVKNPSTVRACLKAAARDMLRRTSQLSLMESASFFFSGTSRLQT